MSNIKVFKFNGSDVPMRSADGEVFVNLTQVAKRFPDKNLSTIINSQEIKEYCDALLKLKNFSFADLLIVRKGAPQNGGGTWAQRKVAIRVAQKLSPELAVFIDAKIEELLFGVRNNADNNLFSAFSDAFAADERQPQQQAINNATDSAGIPSELTERTVQLLNYSQLQQLLTELHNIAASQAQNTTLIARQIELLHNLTLKLEKQISHQSKTKATSGENTQQQPPSADGMQHTDKNGDKIYTFTQASRLLGYRSTPPFTAMLARLNLTIRRFNQTYANEQYAELGIFARSSTAKGHASSLCITERGIEFLRNLISHNSSTLLKKLKAAKAC